MDRLELANIETARLDQDLYRYSIAKAPVAGSTKTNQERVQADLERQEFPEFPANQVPPFGLDGRVRPDTLHFLVDLQTIRKIIHYFHFFY